MALSRVKVWVNEVLTPTDLNAEFNNILNFLNGATVELNSDFTVSGTGTFGLLTALGLLDLSDTTAGQIKFPAAQNASSDANTLDDYEEGTWSPVITFDGESVGQSITANGYYTKIGNLVFYNCEFSFVNKGSSTGTAIITGLPFTSANVTAGRSPAAIYADAMSGLTVPVAYVGPNSTSIALQNFVSNTLTSMSDLNFTNTTNIAVSGIYRV